jgi:hypothetical protein
VAPLAQNIRVATVFEPGGRIRPVWFEWNRQRHLVKETTYRWSGRAGNATLLHFAVTDEANLYELVYNTAEQSWSLCSADAAQR